ncbi:MAG TPA: DUF6597 domain-containing transcriptional factor [Gammaproteobacteria bacterium]|nr:DUF6597 domain-containing transcriptional factor [Gammaproteobacteria bacterium]
MRTRSIAKHLQDRRQLGVASCAISESLERFRFDTAEALPAQRLRPFIARYGAYRAQAVDLGPMRGLPSHYVTVMIGLGSRFQVAGVVSFTSFVSGLHERAAMVESSGTVAGIHLFLDPLGTRAILGCPASALAHRVISLADVIGARADAELHERLHEAGTWQESFAILDAVLQRSLVDGEASREVGFACRRITSCRGHGRVEALASAIGWSRRHLTECFRHELGMTPKTFVRILRGSSTPARCCDAGPATWRAPRLRPATMTKRI